MKFILTRHTTTEWNSVGRIQGQTDISLSQQGKAEAEQLAKLLSGLGINFIVSSDLKRSSETAEIINSLLVVPLQLERRLRECSFGNVEALTKQQAIEQYGSSMAQNWEDQYQSYNFRPFGGEHREDVLERHIEVLELLSSQKLGTTLLVGHGRGLCTLLAGLGQSPELKRGEYRLIEY